MGMDWATSSQGHASCVSIRIGACKPGEDPPPASPSGGESATDISWGRNLWLTIEDFHSLFDQAQTAKSQDWPAPAIIVNGMSDNSGMVWSLEEGRTWLGYEPKDDVQNYPDQIP